MYRKTWMQVDLDAVAENVRTTKEICGKKYIAVLKADAYGCGDRMVMEAVLDAGADMIAVSSIDEAMILRNEGYTGDLMILGPVNAKDTKKLISIKAQCAAYSFEWLDGAVKEGCEGLMVHLAFDTGMNRIGFRKKEDLKKALDLLLENGAVPVGIFTHFCCSDAEDHVVTNRQYALFAEGVRYLDYPFEWIHCDNSDATVFFKDDLSNACRVGITLYGLSPYKKDLPRAVSLYTEVSMVKTVKAGETIGYGATYTAQQDELIATLPIGYADGFIRANQGRKVYIDGQMAEVVGRVCMDQCMVRLEHPVPAGTKAEIFGEHIDLEQMAKELNTISYEVICLITPRVTRRYLYKGKLAAERNTRLILSRLDS